MRVIIVGGTRFIGPAVVRQLLLQGHEVTVFHRGQSNDERTKDARHILGDRKDMPRFRNDFARLRPDVALDMRAMNAAEATLFTETFRDIVGRVVVISSIDVYLAYGRLWNREPGPIEPTPLTETSPLRQTDQPLGKEFDKISVERIVTTCPEFAATILRLPMVYGPGDRMHRLFEYLKRMDDRRPVILLDDMHARWRWIRGYVDNVAAAICLALADRRAAGKTYNVGEQPALTEAEWVQNIARCAGWPGEIVDMPKRFLPEHLRAEYNFEQHLDADTGRIRAELGYQEPISREEALIRTVEWERAHPPEEIEPNDFNYGAEDAAYQEYSASRDQ